MGLDGRGASHKQQTAGECIPPPSELLHKRHTRQTMAPMRGGAPGDAHVDETREAVGHGVVLEAAFAILAIVAAILDGDDREGREAPGGIRGNRQVVEGVADELQLAGPVVGDGHRRGVGVAVGRRDVHEDLPLGAHGLIGWLERGIIAPEDPAVGHSHLELELASLRVAAVGEVGVDAVFGPDHEVAVALGVRCKAGLGFSINSDFGSNTYTKTLVWFR
jgi:hypothetical protein